MVKFNSKYHVIGVECATCGSGIRYINDGRCVACKRKRDKEWREANKQWARDWVDDNRWRLALYRKRTRLRYPEKYRQKRRQNKIRRKRLKKEANQVKYKRHDVLGPRCLACGATDSLSLDHVMPLAMGGDDTPYNLQTLCMVCNYTKGATYREWRPSYMLVSGR